MAGGTVAIQFIRAALVPAKERGIDVGVALRESGISADLLDCDGARVTRAQAAALIRSLWALTDDELIGLPERPLPRGTFLMATLGLVHARDLDTALHRLIEFAGIGMGVDVAAMTDDGETTRLTFGPGEADARSQLVLAIGMAVGHRLANWLIGEQIALTSVDLPGAVPVHAAELLPVFGVEPTFGAPVAALAFPSRHLRAPLVRSEDDLLEFIRHQPHGLLARQDYQPTTASRVRKLIERRAAEVVTVEDVAAPLGISAQHLRRLLRNEGTTFRAIRDQVLRDDAIASLVRGQESVEELSARLGFSESSAFRRAFRRWTGSPPGSYRARR